MPQSLIVIVQQLAHIDVVNLSKGSHATDTRKLLQEIQLLPSMTQESMKVHNLLLLSRLPTKHTKGKESLIDYSQSCVMISSEYLDIIRKKTMGKAATEEIRVAKRKERKIGKLKIRFYIKTSKSKTC
jgi:hypothetical protein